MYSHVKLTYDIHTYTTKTWFSFCTYTRWCDAVNRSIFRFSDRYTCITNIYTAKTWYSLCSYTQNDSNVFAHMLQFIYITHTYTAKTWSSFCAFTRLHDAVNRSIFRFIRSIYTHRNHIHCKDTTQSLLIYIKQQQRLCTHIATHIHYIHIHCKDMIKLLHIYTSAWCNKSIDFSLYQINLHASQSHTLQRHSIVFAHIHRMTATSLHTCCN